MMLFSNVLRSESAVQNARLGIRNSFSKDSLHRDDPQPGAGQKNVARTRSISSLKNESPGVGDVFAPEWQRSPDQSPVPKFRKRSATNEIVRALDMKKRWNINRKLNSDPRNCFGSPRIDEDEEYEEMRSSASMRSFSRNRAPRVRGSYMNATYSSQRKSLFPGRTVAVNLSTDEMQMHSILMPSV